MELYIQSIYILYKKILTLIMSEFTTSYSTQNNLLLVKLMEFYKKDNHLDNMLNIINGESTTSLRIVDWFATNYAKKYYTVYRLKKNNQRFKVYVDYKLKLKAYSKNGLILFVVGNVSPFLIQP